jgi:hypothetical protein
MRRRRTRPPDLPDWEIELWLCLTPEQWDEHEARKKRKAEFDALSISEQIDIARWVLAMDPDLAKQVMNGYPLLFDAYYQLKQAEAFLLELSRRQSR